MQCPSCGKEVKSLQITQSGRIKTTQLPAQYPDGFLGVEGTCEISSTYEHDCGWEFVLVAVGILRPMKTAKVRIFSPVNHTR